MLTTQATLPLIEAQRQFFKTGATLSYEFRARQLTALLDAIQSREAEICAALHQDLHKPAFEATVTEVTYGIEEIRYTLKRLKRWMRPQRVKTGVMLFPARGEIRPEPLGTVLIIGPWNYPFQLAIAPLIGAIAAGNTAILKPSELAPHTSRLIADLIAATFPPHYITAVEGDKEITQDLLQHKFDHIFFTGGTKIGQIIMTAAAQHLTPVTLELGGKSPCIVTADTPLEVAARRIAWGKFINGGQICVAPDYLLVPTAIKADLIAALKRAIVTSYGEDPAQSPDYCRMISDRHWQRLVDLIDPAKVVHGGTSDRETRYIAPTILDGVTWDDPIMAEEIFGPILPILTYDSLEDAIAQINARPKPLALYLFSRDRATQEQVLTRTSSGGVCLNDTIMHLGSPELPFGGVGDSGIGAYHGKYSFDTFSHQKSVLNRGTWLDPALRYPPYAGKLVWFQRLMKS